LAHAGSLKYRKFCRDPNASRRAAPFSRQTVAGRLPKRLFESIAGAEPGSRSEARGASSRRFFSADRFEPVRSPGRVSRPSGFCLCNELRPDFAFWRRQRRKGKGKGKGKGKAKFLIMREFIPHK
jgi:hypothetical protein